MASFCVSRHAARPMMALTGTGAGAGAGPCSQQGAFCCNIGSRLPEALADSLDTCQALPGAGCGGKCFCAIKQ